MGFLYDWQYVFKASEIVDMITTHLIDLEEREIELAEKLVKSKPEDGYSSEVRQALKLLEKEGVIPVRVRRADDTDKKLERVRDSIFRLRRVRHLLQREDPHRQFKVTYNDLADLGYKFR